MCIYMTVEYSLFSCNSIANSIISLHFLTLGTLVLIRWGPTHLQNIVVGKYHPSLKQSERVLRHPMVHRTFEWINTNMSMVKTWKMAWTVDLANSNGWLPWQPSKINMRFCFYSHDLMDFDSNDVSDDESQRLFVGFQLFWKQQKGFCNVLTNIY